MASLFSLPRDVLTHVLSFLHTLADACAVDACHNHAIFAANVNGAWRGVATSVFRLRDTPQVQQRDTWRHVVLTRIKPFVIRLRSLCAAKELTQPSYKALDETYRRCPSLPNETAAFLGALSFLGCPQRFERRRKGGIIQMSSLMLTFGQDDWSDWNEETKDFAYVGQPCLGGGDTNWWMYVVLNGQVSCPEAPRDYCKNCYNMKSKKLRNKTFGPGSVCVFSLWNHGGCEWDADHLPAPWSGVDEFGCESRFETVCDDWVRACIERPIGASQDALPCAWPSFTAFLDEVETTMRSYRKTDQGYLEEIREK